MKRLLIAGVALAAMPMVASAGLFSDNLDAASAANWTLNQGADTDSAQTFGYNYSIDGIPEAPNTTGGNATSGLKLESNIVDPAAVNVYSLVPNGQNFTGTHQLRFDFWMNWNTDVNGAGTTEFLGGGVGHNGTDFDVTSGAQAIWTSDGGSASDWRAFKDGFFVPGADMSGGTRQGADPYYSDFIPSEAPPVDQFQGGVGVAGSPAFKWWTMVISSINPGNGVNQVRMFLENPDTLARLPIATINCNDTSDGSSGCSSEGNISLFYADFFTSVAPDPALQFALIDNVVVDSAPEPASLALLGLGGLLALRRRR